MSNNNPIINSLIAGEVSPRFLGRSDTTQYNQAAEEIRNFIVFPQGGITRRPGTRITKLIQKTDDSAPDFVRLFPFTGSDGSSWNLIMTDEDPEKHKVNGISIVRTSWRMVRTSDGYTEGVFPITYSAPNGLIDNFQFPTDVGWWDMAAKGVDLNAIQFCQAGDTMFFAHGSIRPFRIVYQPKYKIESGHSGHNYPPNSVPETAAFLMLAIPDLRTLNGLATNYKGVRGMPFQAIRTDAVLSVKALSGLHGATVNPVVATVQIDLTTVSNDLQSFDPTYIGRQFKFNKDTSSYGVVITAFVSSTRLLGVAYSAAAFDGLLLLPVVTDISTAKTYGYGTGAVDDSSWEEAYWNDSFGWPQSVCFFESRLIFGGNKKFPDTIWASAINDVFRFDQRGFEQDPNFGTVRSDDPFSQDMKEAQVTSLRWLSPGKTITAGTDCAEFIIEGPDQSKSIGIDNTSSSPETELGVAPLQALRFDGATIFVQRDRKTLREMVFNLEENAFNAPSIGIIAEHIVDKFGIERDIQDYVGAALPGAIFGLARQIIPYGIVWMFDNNGCLLGLTRNRAQNIAAWHTHEIAGTNGAAEATAKLHNSVEYKPKILSISSVRGQQLDEEKYTSEPDDIYLAVRRQQGTNMGALDPANSTWTDIVTLEILTREWHRGRIEKNWTDVLGVIAPIYMDGTIFVASTGSNGPSGVISYPYGTPGDQITVIKDGYDFGEYALSSTLTIDISAKLSTLEKAGDADNPWNAICGYNFVARAIPVTPEVPTQTPGSSLGRKRRIDTLTIYFVRSLGCRFGKLSDENNDGTPFNDPEDIDFPTDQIDVTKPVPLFTGEKVVQFPLGFDSRPRILIESYRPFPCTIPYVVARMVVSES